MSVDIIDRLVGIHGDNIADSAKQTFISAMQLRAKVCWRLAENAGAEPEDMGAIIAKAIIDSAEILTKAFDEISMKEQAIEINKSQHGLDT